MKTVNVAGKAELRGGSLSEQSYLSAFRLAHILQHNLRLMSLKEAFDDRAGRVLDTSCGNRFDRLAGFYVSNATQYHGCSTKPNTYYQYMEQCVYYEGLLGNGGFDVDERVDEKGRNYFTMSGRKFVRYTDVSVFNCFREDIKDIDCVTTEHYTSLLKNIIKVVNTKINHGISLTNTINGVMTSIYLFR